MSSEPIKLNPKQDRLLTRVEQRLAMEGISAPDAMALARELVVPIQAVREIVRLGILAGRIIPLGDELWFVPSTLAKLREVAQKLDTGGGFSVGEFRDATLGSRRTAVPILEYFDEMGWTEFDGTSRRALSPNRS